MHNPIITESTPVDSHLPIYCTLLPSLSESGKVRMKEYFLDKYLKILFEVLCNI
jgi:hypothetical protein